MQTHNETIENAVMLLKEGRVISFPTETVYALACAAGIQSAIDEIFKIKKRSKDMVLAILASNLEMLQQYAITSELALQLIKEFSPGPITYILRAKNNIKLPKALIKDGKIGIRIPDHSIAQDILKRYGKPIVATSVNLSGRPSAVAASEIDEDIKNQISLIIDGGHCKFSTPSSIVEVMENDIKVIREGYMIQEIEEFLNRYRSGRL